ncbi:MAG: alpha/beta hydrolase, partial [Actinomycetota bacterium]|nr:alpha/beta hydrolase [Actinomycetota bacterium]
MNQREERTPGGPRRAVLRCVVVLVLLGAVIVGLAYTFQRAMIYLPDGTPVPPGGEVIAGARDLTLTTGDGLELGAWLVPPAEPARGLAVLVAPGNGGNREGRAGLARELS